MISGGGCGRGRGVIRISCRITIDRRLVRYHRMFCGLLLTAQTEAYGYGDCEERQEREGANDDAGDCTAGKTDSRMWR